MSDGSDQFPIVLERRHIEALLNPEGVNGDLRRDARHLLTGVLSTPPLSNPREAGGKMIDTSGDPHAKGQVMIDSRRAILLEEVEAAVVHATSKGAPHDLVGITLSGRINRPPNVSGERPAEKVSHLHFTEWDGAADIIVELQALAGRAGFDLKPLLEEKWAEFERQGWTTQR